MWIYEQTPRTYVFVKIDLLHAQIMLTIINSNSQHNGKGPIWPFEWAIESSLRRWRRYSYKLWKLCFCREKSIRFRHVYTLSAERHGLKNFPEHWQSSSTKRFLRAFLLYLLHNSPWTWTYSLPIFPSNTEYQVYTFQMWIID